MLVVDDDPALVRVLEVGFETRDYAARVATTGATALATARLRRARRGRSSTSACPTSTASTCAATSGLRTPVPIIVLSADGAEDRKVAALDVGADDYLTKPFSMPELLARVRVALRHRRALSGVVDDELMQVGLLRIDLGGPRGDGRRPSRWT